MIKRNWRVFFSLIISFFISSFLYNFIIQKKSINLFSNPFNNLKKTSYKHKPTIAKTQYLEKNFFLPTLFPSPSATIIKLTPSPTMVIKPTMIIKPSPTKKIIPTDTPFPKKKSLSKSKLSVFMIISFTSGANKILKSCPRLLKVIDPQGNQGFINAIKTYKNDCPDGLTIVRFYPGTQGIKYDLTDNPETSAQDFFKRAIYPNVKALGKDVYLFDYIQMPNEFENTPEWQGEEKMKWNGLFWLRLTELNQSLGLKTCIGSIPVGNSAGEDFSYIIEELRQMKNMGAALCYHSYTFHYSTDINEEIYLSLRYRQYYSYFSQNAPDLLSMPLIISEGGVAENGDPYAGYLKSNKIEEYKSWLTWFDQEIRKDNYVIGVTLFQIGNDSDWGYFNLEPIADWLSNYIDQNR